MTEPMIPRVAARVAFLADVLTDVMAGVILALGACLAVAGEYAFALLSVLVGSGLALNGAGRLRGNIVAAGGTPPRWLDALEVIRAYSANEAPRPTRPARAMTHETTKEAQMPETSALPLHRLFVQDALLVLCGEKPPMELVDRWYDEPDAPGDTLQDWCATNRPREWMTGVGLIDAAEELAAEVNPPDRDPAPIMTPATHGRESWTADDFDFGGIR